MVNSLPQYCLATLIPKTLFGDLKQMKYVTSQFKSKEQHNSHSDNKDVLSEVISLVQVML